MKLNDVINEVLQTYPNAVMIVREYTSMPGFFLAFETPEQGVAASFPLDDFEDKKEVE
jgi:hypothetical protein